MVQKSIPDFLVYLCKNCIPEGAKLPAHWTESGVRVGIKEIPCSGKIDAQYILHSLEGGVRSVCVMSCPHGDCTLSQGNYRAEIRVKTVQRLLSEIGDDSKRAELIQCPQDATLVDIKAIISSSVLRLSGSVRSETSK
jgi:coenzyme F420-reducing hydrogenase delta subunit